MSWSETSLTSPVLWKTPCRIPTSALTLLLKLFLQAELWEKPQEPKDSLHTALGGLGGVLRWQPVAQEWPWSDTKNTEGNAVHSQSMELAGGSELGVQKAFSGSIQNAPRKADSTKYAKLTHLRNSGVGLILKPLWHLPCRWEGENSIVLMDYLSIMQVLPLCPAELWDKLGWEAEKPEPISSEWSTVAHCHLSGCILATGQPKPKDQHISKFLQTCMKLLEFVLNSLKNRHCCMGYPTSGEMKIYQTMGWRTQDLFKVQFLPQFSINFCQGPRDPCGSWMEGGWHELVVWMLVESASQTPPAPKAVHRILSTASWPYLSQSSLIYLKHRPSVSGADAISGMCNAFSTSSLTKMKLRAVPDWILRWTM